MLFTAAPVLLALSLFSSSVLAAPAPRTGASSITGGVPNIPAKRSLNRLRGGSAVRRQAKKAADEDVTAMMAQLTGAKDAAAAAAGGAAGQDAQIQALIDALTAAKSNGAAAGAI